MQTLSGAKILVTGPAGQIAFPLASRLARDNEVWGIARFGDAKSRERVEKAGIQTRAVDLEAPQWGDLPDDFDYVLHLAAFIAPGEDYEMALRVNAEGTGLLMGRCRKARGFLVMSTNSVYSSEADPADPVLEDAPLGSGYQPFAPTYSVSKIAQEAVARTAARTYDLPTIIARMNVAYGDNGGFPAMLLDAILAGQPIAMRPGHPSKSTPIHEDDIFAHTAGLLAAASVPATITNWGGDEHVWIPDLCQYLADLVGKELILEESPEGIDHRQSDPTRRIELAGPCQVPWRDGLRGMVAARHPEIPLRDV